MSYSFNGLCPDVQNTIDQLVAQNKKVNDSSLQTVIHPEILFRYNSVNLIIGPRGSGKTYFMMREIIKLYMLDPNGFNYSQIHYVTSKYNDDTIDMFRKLLPPSVLFNWVDTKDALELIKKISKMKSLINDECWRTEHPNDCKEVLKVMNAEDLPYDFHTLIIFDDSIGLFSKTTELAKQLYQNRQSHITYLIALQDVTGISPSMKSNIDSLTLFGGFSRHKYNILFYQLPSVDYSYEEYSHLTKLDNVHIDFIDSSIQENFR